MELGTLADALFHADFGCIAFYLAPSVVEHVIDRCLDLEIFILLTERYDVLIHRTGAYRADQLGSAVLTFEHGFLVKLILMGDILDAEGGLVVEKSLHLR